MWYRIFCRSSAEVTPEALLAHLHARSMPAVAHFKGDDLGWTSCEMTLGKGSPLLLSRYLTKEDDLRGDLNTWAAELETMDYSANNTQLMERVIQTEQLVTIRKPVDHSDEVILDRLCLELCRFLSTGCDGVYQVDGSGWFAASGELMLQEY